jgi:excinuclease UvrABC nuclease subunit
VRFRKDQAATVPRSRGVYAFLVAFLSDGFPPHGYLMYVGETGDDNQQHLRSRFRSYFLEMGQESRPIHYILRKYEKYLYFHFSAVADRRRNLKKLEAALCDALIPPYNVRDFSAEIRNAKPAF